MAPPHESIARHPRRTILRLEKDSCSEEGGADSLILVIHLEGAMDGGVADSSAVQTGGCTV